MLEKVNILKIYTSNEDKNKNPFKTKDGKPFWKVAIKTDKHGDIWHSCLAFRQDDSVMKLKEGDNVLIKTEKNGEYYNFSLPSKLDLLEERVSKLEQYIINQSKEIKYPTAGVDEIDPSEIPF